MVLSALKNVDFEIFVKIRGFPNSGFSLLSLSLSLSLPSSSSASDSLFLLLPCFQRGMAVSVYGRCPVSFPMAGSFVH